MLSPDEQKKADAIRQTGMMLSASFFMTVGVMAFALFNKSATNVPQPEGAAPLFIPFVLAALVAGAASVVVPGILRAKKKTHNEEMRDQMTGAAPAPSVQSQMSLHLVAMCLSEAPAIFGFLLAQSSNKPAMAVPFFGASVVLMVYHCFRFLGDRG